MNLEQIVADLVEKVDCRFYGKYRGFVVDNADPEKLGRLTLRVPSLLGPDVVTGWALPCVPYGGAVNQGFLFVPEKEAGVWVEFEEGDLEFPIWTGTFWSKPSGDSELPKPNDEQCKEDSSPQDPPTRKIIKTRAKHSIQFEDAADKEMVMLIDGKNKHVITLDKKGITITDGVNEHVILMNDKGITMTDGVNKHSITLEKDAVTIDSKADVNINGGKIVLTAKGELTITASDELTAKGSKILLNP
jgi:uncharacterized protein involved in type VI secretion and phage assembly